MKIPRYSKKTPVPYYSRLNIHLVEQQLRDHRIQIVKQISTEKRHIQQQLSLEHVTCSGIGDIVSARQLILYHTQLRAKLVVLDNKLDAWDRKTEILIRTCRSKQISGTLSILNRMLCPSSVESLFLDIDICHKCNELLVFCAVTYTNTCPKCSSTTCVLVASEDMLSDVLIYRLQYPVCNAIEVENRFVMADTVVPQRSTIYLNTKILAYSRYLEQFSELFPVIPVDLMNCVYRLLSTIHIHTPHRCRPTPVANILRTNGYMAWCYAATRISFFFNGQTIPILTVANIEQLSERFKVLFRASMLPQYKMKLPNFEIITHCMLRIDGYHELARCFQLNKTCAALYTVNERIQQLISIAAKIDTKFTWVGCDRLF